MNLEKDAIMAAEKEQRKGVSTTRKNSSETRFVHWVPNTDTPHQKQSHSLFLPISQHTMDAGGHCLD